MRMSQMFNFLILFIFFMITNLKTEKFSHVCYFVTRYYCKFKSCNQKLREMYLLIFHPSMKVQLY